ncbi:MAG: hypothetical protein GF334_04435 [Candidatus Altiarchaeales archaeon]|nr:hypothetical protein [Candidatus Altiarchaeales archaeon]
MNIVNTLEAAKEMAQMQMPARYRVNNKSFFQRAIQFLKPGPKPVTKQVTYRVPGTNLASTLLKIGEPKQGRIDFQTMEVMRHHPMIKLGLIVRSAPILAALKQARAECQDRNIAEFVKKTFIKTWLQKVGNTTVVPSYIYGVAPHEKVWHTVPVDVRYTDEEGNEQTAYQGDALIYKKIKFVHPKTLDKFMIDEEDDFAGFQQKKRPGDANERIVEPWKSFVYTNKFIYAGMWGEAELDDVYAYWYYSEFFGALRADYLRFRTIPPIVGHAPVGISVDDDGTEIDNISYAGEILQKALENLVVVLPFETDDRGNQMWGFQEMDFGVKGQEIYTRAIEELDVMILRGLIVPERTVTQNMAAVGSYNQAEIHAEMMLEFAKTELDRFIDACNTWLIPQLVEDNFGANAPRCEIRVSALPEALLAKLHNIVITLLQNDKTGILNQQVDFTELLNILDIPWKISGGFPEPVLPDDDTPEEEPDEEE